MAISVVNKMNNYVHYILETMNTSK